jgi:hypothetical protein
MASGHWVQGSEVQGSRFPAAESRTARIFGLHLSSVN